LKAFCVPGLIWTELYTVVVYLFIRYMVERELLLVRRWCAHYTTHILRGVLSLAFAGGLNGYVPVRLLVGCVVIARSCYAGNETVRTILLVLHRVFHSRLTSHTKHTFYYPYVHSLKDSRSDEDVDVSMQGDQTKRIV
jgi:hypothetical protein